MSRAGLLVTALDVETTGLCPASGDRVCEIALVRLREDSSVADRLVSLINPERPIPPGASRINGITDEMVRDAPVFPVVAGRAAELIRDSILLIHNARFDISFLRAEFARAGAAFPETRYVDTLEIARMHANFFHFAAGRSLAALAAHFGIPQDLAHRAEADACTAYRVYRALLGQLETIGRGPEEFVRFTRDIGVFDRGPLAAALLRAAAEGRRVLIRYVARDRRETLREVEPRTVRTEFGAVWLTAFCVARGEERLFRLDRIREVRENKEYGKED